jgi:hypothetical protein
VRRVSFQVPKQWHIEHGTCSWSGVSGQGVGPMDKVRKASADVLAYQTGNLASALGPLMIGAAGVLLFIIALGLPASYPVLVGALALLSLGVTAGGVFAFLRALSRSGIILDRASGRATVWRRMIVPLPSKTRDLAEFGTVLMTTARVQKRYVSGIVYLVGLHGDTGEPLPLDWYEEYMPARRFAEDAAAFLGLPLTDASGTETIVSTAGKPNLTPHDVHLAVPALAAPPPAKMLCRLSWHGPALRIEEPRIRLRRLIGFPLLIFLLLAVPCLGLGTLAHFFGTAHAVTADPLLASAIVVGILFLIFAVSVIASLPQLWRRHVVQADRNLLRFKTLAPFANKETSIRSKDVCELRIALGHLTVTTPRDSRVVCGWLNNPLPRAELEWLRDQLAEALKG